MPPNRLRRGSSPRSTAGVFGVELLIRGDEVYFADVTAHPCDSGGDPAIAAAVTVRSACPGNPGSSVDTIMISPGAAEVWYSGAVVNGDLLLASALAVPESDVRLFGRHEDSSRIRLGMVLATAPDVTTARDRVRTASNAL